MLYYLKQQQWSVEDLLTNITIQQRQVAMHRIHEKWIDLQCESLQIGLKKFYLPEMPSRVIYEEYMTELYWDYKMKGVDYIGSGDLFLEDIRDYKNRLFEKVKMEGVYPLWGRPSSALVKEFIDLGFKAKVICINADKLDKSFLGREIDTSFVKDYPDNCDLCGENGEYHSFVYDGPFFEKSIDFDIGEPYAKLYPSMSGNVDQEYWYVDLQ